ncbi:MAG: FkbM family methyltransferase, partial [Terriglobia bacterium]
IRIQDSDNYLCNHVFSPTGIPVAETTIDAIHKELGLGRVNFLKMNIEGAERLAMRGMVETLKCTEVVCVSCHDFLAEATDNEFFRTRSAVKTFLHQNGFHVAERLEKDLPSYVRDQVWAYSELLITGRPGNGLP